jgi:hypothetical protein
MNLKPGDDLASIDGSHNGVRTRASPKLVTTPKRIELALRLARQHEFVALIGRKMRVIGGFLVRTPGGVLGTCFVLQFMSIGDFFVKWRPAPLAIWGWVFCHSKCKGSRPTAGVTGGQPHVYVL